MPEEENAVLFLKYNSFYICVHFFNLTKCIVNGYSIVFHLSSSFIYNTFVIVVTTLPN